MVVAGGGVSVTGKDAGGRLMICLIASVRREDGEGGSRRGRR